MKKPTLIVLVLLAFGFNLKAQQFVSTQPAGRNVIIEEFTGRGCGYCPDGHRIANEIMANNPGRVWAINIHAGSYAQTSYPNMITNDGNTIHNGFTITGYPCGIVNRSSGTTSDRWNKYCFGFIDGFYSFNIFSLVSEKPGQSNNLDRSFRANISN